MKKEFIQLISRIMGFRALYFNGSQVMLLGIPMIVLPMDAFSKMQKKLIDEFGYDDILSVFSELGKIQGYNGSSIFIKKYKIKSDLSDINFFIEQTKLIGMGNVKLEAIDGEKKCGKVAYYNSPEAIAYKSNFGIQEKPVDFYQTGLITGAAQAILGGNLCGVEVQCLAKGDEHCVIEVNQNDEWLKDLKYKKFLPKRIEEIEEIRQKEDLNALLEPIQLKIKNTETELSMLLKKRFKNEMFEFSETGIKILGIQGLITPIEIISLLAYVMKKRWGAVAFDIAYDVGKEEGAKAIEVILKELPLKKDAYGISRAIEVIGLYGLGKPEIIKAMPETGYVLIKVYENYLAKKYLKFFSAQKNPIDNYLAGILAGLISRLLEKDIDLIEKQCIAQGKEYCIFETTKK